MKWRTILIPTLLIGLGDTRRISRISSVCAKRVSGISL